MTITYDNKTSTISAILTADEQAVFIKYGSLANLQAQAETWLSAIFAKSIDSDKVALRGALDKASSAQLQAAKTALGI